MSGLFDNDEAYIQAEVRKKRKPVRNRAGRFCSELERKAEQVQHENDVLRRKVQVYFANWKACCDRAVRLDRMNHEMKEELQVLRRKIKKYEKRPKRKAGKARQVTI